QDLKVENVDELKVRMKESIVNAKTQMADDMISERLLDALLAKSRVVVAETTWEGVANRRLAEMDNELRSQNSDLRTYAAGQKLTLEELADLVRAEAKVHVERAVMIERIFREEKMEITDEDANAHLMDVLIQNQVRQEDAPRFLKEYGGAIREEVIYRAMNAKVIGFLKSEAKITEPAKG
ncbi:MAG: hypothetical protein MH204_01860, partial [Fimbriimonadaceae bacterium]|nr:hypothetical protein [Fimbriimonadaceae bacterium]